VKTLRRMCSRRQVLVLDPWRGAHNAGWLVAGAVPIPVWVWVVAERGLAQALHGRNAARAGRSRCGPQQWGTNCCSVIWKVIDQTWGGQHPTKFRAGTDRCRERAEVSVQDFEVTNANAEIVVYANDRPVLKYGGRWANQSNAPGFMPTGW